MMMMIIIIIIIIIIIKSFRMVGTPTILGKTEGPFTLFSAQQYPPPI